MDNKKYRVRFVVDDVLGANSPREAKEIFEDLIYSGWYGSRNYLMANNMTARRRKDLEGNSRNE